MGYSLKPAGTGTDSNSPNFPAKTTEPQTDAVGSREAGSLTESTKLSQEQRDSFAEPVSAPNTPQGGSFATQEIDNNHALKLLHSSIVAFKDENRQQYEQELQYLIEQIHSIRLTPHEGSQAEVLFPSIYSGQSNTVPTNRDKSAIVPGKELAGVYSSTSGGTISQSQPADMQQADNALKEAGQGPIYRPVSKETLQIIEQFFKGFVFGQEGQKPGPHKLSELADILFLSDRLEQAAMFYQQALESITSVDAKSAQHSMAYTSDPASRELRDRDWILFQLANCLRNKDLPAARDTYRQLIADYPNSPWVEPAKSRGQLIDWYLRDNPLTLIEQIKTENEE